MSQRFWFGLLAAGTVAVVMSCWPVSIYAQHGGHGGGHAGHGGHGGFGGHSAHGGFSGSHYGHHSGGLHSGYGGYGYGGYGYGGLHHHNYSGYNSFGYSSWPRTGIYINGFGLGYGYYGGTGLGGYGYGWPGGGLGYSYRSLYPYGYGYSGYGIGSSVYGYPGYSAGGLSLGAYTSDPLYGSGTTTYYPPSVADSSRTPPTPGTSSSDEFFRAASDSFRAGQYAAAQRQANHAVVEDPNQARNHELSSLAMFAQGDYPGAAAAARSAIELGPVSDWPTLYRYYGNKDRYTAHLRSLQQFVQKQPDSLDGRFLLGLHLMMMGYKDEARQEFADYLGLAKEPDPMVSKLYNQLGGDKKSLPPPPAATSELDAAKPAGEAK